MRWNRKREGIKGEVVLNTKRNRQRDGTEVYFCVDGILDISILSNARHELKYHP